MEEYCYIFHLLYLNSMIELIESMFVEFSWRNLEDSVRPFNSGVVTFEWIVSVIWRVLWADLVGGLVGKVLEDLPSSSLVYIY